MSTLQSNRRTEGPGRAGWAAITVGCVIGMIGVVMLAAWQLGATFDDAAGNAWTSTATLIAVVGTVIVLALTVAVLWAVTRSTTSATRVDAAAKYLGNHNKRDVTAFTIEEAAKQAERLHATSAGPGVPIGEAVGSKTALYSTWEQVRLSVMGPRAGKTSSMAVRELVECKGPAIATSNKRDIVDLTRGPRSEIGGVRVHDLQGLIGEEPTWWWDPLSYATSVDRADELADVFIAAVTDAGSKQDAYFSGAAKKTLSAMLLAAHCGQQNVSVLLDWLSRPDNSNAVDLLAEGGFIGAATALQGQIDLTSKQRDGVFGTALEWVGFLRNRDVMRWAERQGPMDSRPHFDVAAFAGSTDTLYLISKEGAGSARALTGALTMAVLDAADKLGSRSPDMRLPRPMMATLDEAANVTRLRQLPDLYSYYGSRGIILSVFLQSWSQGVEAWGENGMKKMWSAANIRLVGAGVAEEGFLRQIAELVGSKEIVRSSTSTGRGQRSTSRSTQRERILDVSEISEMPGGRALMFASGSRAILVRLVPWWEKPYAQSVKDSKEFYESEAVTA